jgi:hypothetical protein
MLTDSELGEKKLGLRTQLMNLMLIFRRFRQGEFAFEHKGRLFFEDQLVEVGAELNLLLIDYDARLEESMDLLRKTAEIVERNAPPTMPAADVVEIGELVAAHEAIMPGVDDHFPTPPADAEPMMPTPVYQPEENLRRRGVLQDMATPREQSNNILLFTGVRRSRPEGGAA